MSYSNLLYRFLYVKNLLTIAKDEEGQGLAEYGLIVALIAVVAIAAVRALGTDVAAMLQQLADAF
jgi:pilus assembly protein Flp/PilA